jgi:diadenosine tetraphosphatase ApaH/serine/threonine PP2A family protein phosphatase
MKNGKIDDTLEQFKPVTWVYRSLSPVYLDYLINLPETAQVADDGSTIYLNHAINLFYRTPGLDCFNSWKYNEMIKQGAFPRDQYLTLARAAVLASPEALAAMEALPVGVHLFGHIHLPFYMEHKGRLFINPGSCGEPLDGDTAAPYTLLIRDGNGWQVEERRVVYDLEATAQEMDRCGYTDYAPVWSGVMKKELFTARNYFLPFLMHLNETAKLMGKTEYPHRNEVWFEAVLTWNVNNI